MHIIFFREFREKKIELTFQLTGDLGGDLDVGTGNYLLKYLIILRLMIYKRFNLKKNDRYDLKFKMKLILHMLFSCLLRIQIFHERHFLLSFWSHSEWTNKYIAIIEIIKSSGSYFKIVNIELHYPKKRDYRLCPRAIKKITACSISILEWTPVQFSWPTTTSCILLFILRIYLHTFRGISLKMLYIKYIQGFRDIMGNGSNENAYFCFLNIGSENSWPWIFLTVSITSKAYNN